MRLRFRRSEDSTFLGFYRCWHRLFGSTGFYWDDIKSLEMCYHQHGNANRFIYSVSVHLFIGVSGGLGLINLIMDVAQYVQQACSLRGLLEMDSSWR